MSRVGLLCLWLGLVIGGRAGAQVVHFTNGLEVWSSFDSGVTFEHTGTFDSVDGGALPPEVTQINSMAVHWPSGVLFAGDGDILYVATGLGTPSPHLETVGPVGGTNPCISFDFAGTLFRGTRSNNLVEFDLLIGPPPVIINNQTGGSYFRSTAIVGGVHYGVNASDVFRRIDTEGTGLRIGELGVSDTSSAGGAEFAGYYYHCFHRISDHQAHFGTIDLATGLFSEIATIDLGVAIPGMGLVVLPAGCRADLNGDLRLNFFDVQGYLNFYASGDDRADFNDDNHLDFFDVQRFLSLYSAGCG